MSVVGAAVAVLADRPPEFGHGQDDHVAHAITQVAIERGQGKTELAQPRGQLAFARALIHMRVPAAAIGERDLQPYVGFDQLRDLQQGSAQAARRILRAISGTVLRGVGAL